MAESKSVVEQTLVFRFLQQNSQFDKFFDEHFRRRQVIEINQFNQELKLLQKPLTVVLHTEMTDRLVWSRLIYAEEVSTYAGLQSRRYELG